MQTRRGHLQCTVAKLRFRAHRPDQQFGGLLVGEKTSADVPDLGLRGKPVCRLDLRPASIRKRFRISSMRLDALREEILCSFPGVLKKMCAEHSHRWFGGL